MLSSVLLSDSSIFLCIFSTFFSTLFTSSFALATPSVFSCTCPCSSSTFWFTSCTFDVMLWAKFMQERQAQNTCPVSFFCNSIILNRLSEIPAHSLWDHNLQRVQSTQNCVPVQFFPHPRHGSLSFGAICRSLPATRLLQQRLRQYFVHVSVLFFFFFFFFAQI
jgi:hypothetical protein